MILDSSAVIAILFGEDDAQTFTDAIALDVTPRMSAASFLETGINVDAQADPAAGRQLDALIERAGVHIEPVTAAQARSARQAYLDFGKGHHPAGLNFGDCFAYALANETGQPLLFKGNDFTQTDIESAL